MFQNREKGVSRPFDFYMYYKYGHRGKGGWNREEGREGRLPSILYENYLFLCGESEDDLQAMVGRFVEVCRRRGIKDNADKSKRWC